MLTIYKAVLDQVIAFVSGPVFFAQVEFSINIFSNFGENRNH